MKSFIAAIVCLYFTLSSAFADQLQVMSKAEADSAASYINAHPHIVLHCACCNADQKTYLRVQSAIAKHDDLWEPEEDRYNVVVTGIQANGLTTTEVLDLAYAFVVRDGKAYCIGLELAMNCDPCTPPFDFEIPDVATAIEARWDFGPMEYESAKPVTRFEGFLPEGKDPQLRLKTEGNWATAIGFSRDEKYVITGGGYFDKPGVIEIFQLPSGKKVHTLTGHTQQVEKLVVSPIADLAFACDRAGHLIAWDYLSGKQRYDIQAHNGWIEGIAISPSGNYIATASRDQYVRVWEAKTGNKVREFYLSEGIAVSVQFSSTNELLAVGLKSPIDNFFIFDLSNGERYFQARPSGDWVRDIQFLNSDTQVITANDCDYNWSILTLPYTDEQTFGAGAGCVIALDFDATGRYLAIGCLWGFEIYDFENSAEVFSARPHEFPIEDVVFSPANKWLGTAARGSEVCIWKLK